MHEMWDKSETTIRQMNNLFHSGWYNSVLISHNTPAKQNVHRNSYRVYYWNAEGKMEERIVNYIISKPLVIANIVSG
jgi:hypothetical protein